MDVPSRPPNPALPYREDCWSEGETSVLVDAWGDRFLDLNRGNLRQKQWQEVADSVNARPGAGRRPPRTDVQCKNRIDTLKKKYKIEKGKISDGAFGSQWPFYSRLDILIGSSVAVKKQLLSSSSPPLALPLPSYRKGLALPAAAAVRAVETLPKDKRSASAGFSVDDSFFGRNYRVAAAAAAAAAEVESGSSSKLSGSSTERSRSSRERSARGLRKRSKGREGGGIGELTRVIEWFADIYEKVEVEKQRQLIELEKERLEFIKGLEFQRMQMFVDAQVQVEKIKRARRSDTVISKKHKYLSDLSKYHRINHDGAEKIIVEARTKHEMRETTIFPNPNTLSHLNQRRVICFSSWIWGKLMIKYLGRL